MKILDDRVIFLNYDEFKKTFHSVDGDKFFELFLKRETYIIYDVTLKVVSIEEFKRMKEDVREDKQTKRTTSSVN